MAHPLQHMRAERLVQVRYVKNPYDEQNASIVLSLCHIA
jgi:hypothetical protein